MIYVDRVHNHVARADCSAVVVSISIIPDTWRMCHAGYNFLHLLHGFHSCVNVDTGSPNSSVRSICVPVSASACTKISVLSLL